jgi:hypothetical protein
MALRDRNDEKENLVTPEPGHDNRAEVEGRHVQQDYKRRSGCTRIFVAGTGNGRFYHIA